MCYVPGFSCPHVSGLSYTLTGIWGGLGRGRILKTLVINLYVYVFPDEPIRFLPIQE